MAKKSQDFASIVHISQIVWFRDHNDARPTGNYGKFDDLKSSFIERGWLKDNNGMVAVESASAEDKERGLRERQQQWDALKAASKQDAAKLIDLAAWEEIWVSGGKLRGIDYVGISGNRRSEAYFPAMVERRKGNLPITTEVPALVYNNLSPLERLEVQIDENEMKAWGFQDMSDVDRLLSANKAVELGANQTQLRRTFKDGTGQKLWAVIRLDKRFPNIGIIRRCTLEPQDPAWVNLRGMKYHPDLASLLLRTDPEALAEKNQKQLLQGLEPIAPATEDDVTAYVGGKKTDDNGNKPKVMKGDNIRGLADSFPALPLRAMAAAIANSQVDGLKIYQAAAPGFNALDTVIKSGDYPAVERILLGIVAQQGQNRIDLLAKLVGCL